MNLCSRIRQDSFSDCAGTFCLAVCANAAVEVIASASTKRYAMRISHLFLPFGVQGLVRTVAIRNAMAQDFATIEAQASLRSEWLPLSPIFFVSDIPHAREARPLRSTLAASSSVSNPQTTTRLIPRTRHVSIAAWIRAKGRAETGGARYHHQRRYAALRQLRVRRCAAR